MEVNETGMRPVLAIKKPFPIDLEGAFRRLIL